MRVEEPAGAAWDALMLGGAWRDCDTPAALAEAERALVRRDA